MHVLFPLFFCLVAGWGGGGGGGGGVGVGAVSFELILFFKHIHIHIFQILFPDFEIADAVYKSLNVHSSVIRILLFETVDFYSVLLIYICCIWICVIIRIDLLVYPSAFGIREPVSVRASVYVLTTRCVFTKFYLKGLKPDAFL